MKISIIISFTLCVFLSKNCLAESNINSVELKTITYENLPKVDWIYNVDASNGHVGTISDEKKTFQLFSDEGKLLFVKAVSDEKKFSVVRMNDNPGYVLLGTYSNSYYYYDLYNFSGEQLINTIKSKNVIWASPNCSYFFSRNESGKNNRKPQVFDSNGGLLVTFNNVYSNWEINSVSDSLLLFQNDKNIQLISVPDLSIKKEIIISELFEHPSRVITAISKDGSTYAFSTNTKILVVDLHSGETFSVLKDGTYFPINAEFCLSKDGQYLITYRSSKLGQKIDVYNRERVNYTKICESYYLSEFGNWSCKKDVVVIDNSYCGITYFTNQEGYMLSKTFIFELPNQNSEQINGFLIDGFITNELVDENQESLLYRVYSIKDKRSNLYKIQGELKEID